MIGSTLAIATVLFFMRPPAIVQEPVYAAVPVDAARVEFQQVRIPVQAQGTVTPLQQTTVLAEVRGRIIEVSDTFLVGGFVEEGEVLLRIDPRDHQTALLRAQAAVESAESSLAQEKGRAQVAENEWQRLPKNSQRSPEAKDLYLRIPQLEQAQAQSLAARADMDTARDNLERTLIRSPYDALIRSKNVDLGQFVSPGTALTELFSVETAEVRLPIPQSRLGFLELPSVRGYEQGAEIDLYTDVAGKVSHWRATLHRTEGIFDERSRALYAVARIDDPYALLDTSKQPLRIGTFVNANIEGKAMDDLVALPRNVLRAGNLLWVIDENNILRTRKVDALRAGGDFVYITSGLQPGELVALTVLDSSFGGSEAELISVTPSSQLQNPMENKGALPREEAQVSGGLSAGDGLAETEAS
jgi:RND family efflux transporter MFP subunit